jgi:hypothetical protein
MLLDNCLVVGQVNGNNNKLTILSQFPLVTCSIVVNPPPVLLTDSRHYVHKDKIFLIKNPTETFRVETCCIDEVCVNFRYNYKHTKYMFSLVFLLLFLFFVFSIRFFTPYNIFFNMHIIQPHVYTYTHIFTHRKSNGWLV